MKTRVIDLNLKFLKVIKMFEDLVYLIICAYNWFYTLIQKVTDITDSDRLATPGLSFLWDHIPETFLLSAYTILFKP